MRVVSLREQHLRAEASRNEEEAREYRRNGILFDQWGTPIDAARLVGDRAERGIYTEAEVMDILSILETGKLSAPEPTDAVGRPLSIHEDNLVDEEPQMPEWETLPDQGLMGRDYVVRLPFDIEVGSYGERADAIHRWYNHYERSWVVSFALLTDFSDGRGEVPAQVGPSQYVSSKDDSQHEAERFWGQALASPRFTPEVEVEVDGVTVTVDPEVADHVEQGWSVGESEDIADHDEGLHDEESVPGCPRCDDLYDEDEPCQCSNGPHAGGFASPGCAFGPEPTPEVTYSGGIDARRTGTCSCGWTTTQPDLSLAMLVGEQHLKGHALNAQRPPEPEEPLFTVGFSDETLAQMRADGVLPTKTDRILTAHVAQLALPLAERTLNPETHGLPLTVEEAWVLVTLDLVDLPSGNLMVFQGDSDCQSVEDHDPETDECLCWVGALGRAEYDGIDDLRAQAPVEWWPTDASSFAVAR